MRTSNICQAAASSVIALIAAAAFAQEGSGKNSAQQYTFNSNHQLAGISVRAGGLSLELETDSQTGFLKAGDMPKLTKKKDADGRDIAIQTEDGAPIAEINVRANGHPEKVTLGNGLRYSVVAQGNGLYKESLFDGKGKVLNARSISPDPRRPIEVINLDPVARDLGLTSDWRNEVIYASSDSLVTISDKAGKVLVYVLRNGPNSVGFDATGKPLYYDVMTFLFVGRADVDKEYIDLGPLVPDHFIYTRDGRIGAYVSIPATTGIHSFWTERDASGANVVKFMGGVVASRGTSGNSADVSGASPDPQQDAAGSHDASRRHLRPVVNETYQCTTTQVCFSTDYGESGCFPAQTTCQCMDCAVGGGGTSTSGGGTSSGSTSNQISGDAILRSAVDSGILNASQKLGNSQCANLLSNLTTTSPLSGGTKLQTIMNQRGWSDPQLYLGNGIAFYPGQTHKDSYLQTPCEQGSRYAWTTPGLTSVYVCDLFKQLAGTPAMAGVYVIHELLHTLGLPEGGRGQYTHQQITDMVSLNCGTN